MTLPILRGLLQDFMKTLFEEEVVNDKFNVILALKRIGEPDRVVKLIEKYIANVGNIMSELYRHIDDPKVNFYKMASLVYEIQLMSASIGAEQMRLACPNVIKACDEKNHNNFSRSVSWLKNEFSKTRTKLSAFAQMEQRIIRLEGSQPSASCSQSSN